ncbi:MAG: flagellin [Gammaproteobacteria bacterium]
MAQFINTNVASLNAQRNLGRSQTGMNTAMQRLSTGLRINSAKDDAAGLAISERFTTQIRGLDQAMRNANDGISLAQTAEGAMGELTSNLQRIRELAVQSANVTNSASDRQALDAEVQQRIAEIDRISTQTSFNGLKVLDGSAGAATFQVGANVGETISLGLSTNVRSGALGQIASDERQVTGTGLTNGGLTIAVGNTAAVSIGASDSGSAQDVAEAINSSGVAGLTTTATNEQTGTFAAIGGSATDTYALTINDQVIFAPATDAAAGITAGEVVDQINLFSNTTGVVASLDGSTVTLTAEDGRNITTVEAATEGTSGFASDTYEGQVTLTASENITFGGTQSTAVLGSPAVITKDTDTLENVSITSVDNANDAIARIDSALTAVSSFRSDLGAIQNRLESTINNLQTTSENLSASRGRIQDADFASETANLTKAQILQQAGVAMLSQANTQPQIALSLLG